MVNDCLWQKVLSGKVDFKDGPLMGKNVRAEELGTGKKAVDNITRERKQ